jgi:hypothetical protein
MPTLQQAPLGTTCADTTMPFVLESAASPGVD